MPTITIQISLEQLQKLLSSRDIKCDVVEDSQSLTLKELRSTDNSFFEFFKEQIRKLQAGGNQRTLETYRAAYNKFSRFRGDEDVSFDEFDSDLMEAFQVYMRGHNLAMNTVSFHFRILRAVYNKAVEQRHIINKQPFRHVFTGHPKTSKRAITLQELKRLRELELDDEKMAFARDIFLFSFYTRGMAFVDIAYLRRSDINNGVLTYKRKKTGQMLSMRWEESMQEIVDRFPSATKRYLLPIIRKLNGKERNQYRNLQAKVNSRLKTLACMAGIDQNLTMYCARHTWATIAKELKVPIEVISRGMGHTNERTTQIYLKSIDVTSIDHANRFIMDTLFRPAETEEAKEGGK